LKSLLFVVVCLSFSSLSYANTELPGLSEFIDEMYEQHGFDKAKLTSTFEQVEVKQSILKAISRPAEKSKPWYDYRKIFITQKRIKGGVTFWQVHGEALAKAELEYGVPAEIIIAILGVETSYGGNVGSYRVIDALSTLAFRYPPRSKFFRSELGHFLSLTREEKMPLLSPIGSYAGAMGLGQFMPSSYRAYAVDFDGDGKRDIWTNPVDAIGSIAHYLSRHGWVAGESIAHKTSMAGAVPTMLLEKGSKPSINRGQLHDVGVSTMSLPTDANHLALITLTQHEGEEYWLTRQNFYSITRYNHSRMYAMVVTQLAALIRQQYEPTNANK
jgi:membrane-bound lytic murein transglycosylase B